jgi:hypothetical protein
MAKTTKHTNGKRLAGWWVCYYTVDQFGTMWDYQSGDRFTLSQEKQLAAKVAELESQGFTVEVWPSWE